jgi:hypothetical protein
MASIVTLIVVCCGISVNLLTILLLLLLLMDRCTERRGWRGRWVEPNSHDVAQVGEEVEGSYSALDGLWDASSYSHDESPVADPTA